MGEGYKYKALGGDGATLGSRLMTGEGKGGCVGAYSLGDTETGDSGEVTRTLPPPPDASPADGGENTWRGDAGSGAGGVLG